MTATGKPVEWRQLTIGATVWAPAGPGWRPAIVKGFGRNRGERTVVLLRFGKTWRFADFDDGVGNGRRYAEQLVWRDRQAPTKGTSGKPARRHPERTPNGETVFGCACDGVSHIPELP
jgi:hypothetical protein